MVSVNTIQAGTVFAWFMLILLLRRLVLLTVLAVGGLKRPIRPERVPEDKIFQRGTVVAQFVDGVPVAYTKDTRANKVIENDSENDAYFVVLLVATAVFLDSVNVDRVRTITYGAIYLFFRTLHAAAYIFGLQPWRTLFFFMGLFCTIACNLDLVIVMSRRSN